MSPFRFVPFNQSDRIYKVCSESLFYSDFFFFHILINVPQVQGQKDTHSRGGVTEKAA